MQWGFAVRGFEVNVIVDGRLKAIFVKRMYLLRSSYCEYLYSHYDGLLTDSLISKMVFDWQKE